MNDEMFYFDFVNKSYSDEEIKNRADWYIKEAQRGLRIADESKKKQEKYYII